MRIVHFVIAFGFLGGCLLWAEVAAPRTPVTREEVRQAVRRESQAQGLGDEPWPSAEEIELPVAVAATAERSLRVTAACWDSGRERVQFRIECREPKQCMPFLAYARMKSASQKDPMVVVSCRTASPTKASSRRPEPRIVLQSGDQASVVFIGRRLRLTAEVTCLERGAEGEIIRVRNREGRTFRARVSGPGLLRAVDEP